MARGKNSRQAQRAPAGNISISRHKRHCQHCGPLRALSRYAYPLPKVGSPELQRIADEDPDSLSVYNICLNYEEELAASKDNNKLRHVRILGFLMLHAPNPGVRSEIAKYIHSRRPGSNVTDVGAFFERNVILPCVFAFTPRMLIFFSQEVQRSNAETQRTLLKVLL